MPLCPEGISGHALCFHQHTLQHPTDGVTSVERFLNAFDLLPLMSWQAAWIQDS